jgi:hypothetical protein
MMETAPPPSEGTPLDPGLRALCGIAAYYRIAADPVQLTRELALGARQANEADLIPAAKLIGLKARLVEKVTAERLATLPTPAIVRMTSGALMVFGGRNPSGFCRLVDPISHAAHEAPKTSRATSGRRCLSPAGSGAPASIRASSACVGSCRPSGAIAVRLAMCLRRRCSCRFSASRRRCSFRWSSTRC